MAALKAGVNLFALLDGNDPGDTRLEDLVAAAPAPKKKPARKAKKQQAPPKSPNPAVEAGLRSAAAGSMARTMSKQQKQKPSTPAPRANLTGALFGKAYPSARERIFRQRQEELQARAKVASDGKGSAADQGGNNNGGAARKQKEQQQGVAVNEAPAPAAEEETPLPPTPPPRLDDVDQFPSLK